MISLRLVGAVRIAYDWLRKFVFVCLSAVLEKNPTKVLAVDAPIVFSASRIVVLAFAWVLIGRIRQHGLTGWPDATLSCVLAIALPVIGALSKVQPADVVAFAAKIVDKLGAGDIGSAGGPGGAR